MVLHPENLLKLGGSIFVDTQHFARMQGNTLKNLYNASSLDWNMGNIQ